MSERIIRLIDDPPQEVFDAIEDVLDAYQVEYRVETIDLAAQNSNGAGQAPRFVYPRKGTQRWIILMAIRDSASRGMTREELGSFMQKSGIKMAKGSLEARVWELGPKNLGYIKPSGKQRRTSSNVYVEVLVLSDAGKAAIRQHEDSEAGR